MKFSRKLNIRRALGSLLYLTIAAVPFAFSAYCAYMAVRSAYAGLILPAVLLAVAAFVAFQCCALPAMRDFVCYLRRKEGDTEI